MAFDVATLRELFRGLQAFRATYEEHGVSEITDNDGVVWAIHDLEYLYADGLPKLPPRQRQAIELCLVRNMREKDAAQRMGVAETNPVAMYAGDGLKNLMKMIERGELPRFRVLSQEATG